MSVNAAEMTLAPLIFILLFTAEGSIILLSLNNTMTEPRINVIHVTEATQKSDLRTTFELFDTVLTPAGF